MFLSIDLYVDFLSGLRFSSIYSDDRFDVVCLFTTLSQWTDWV